jgi:hypothetical protein
MIRTGRGRNRNSCACEFRIALRSDDEAILQEIKDRLGVGQIYVYVRNAPRYDGACLHVTSKPDCCFLVDYFELYPLRAKKANDFEVWSEAVRAWEVQDWEHMKELAQRIVEVRNPRVGLGGGTGN